MEFQGLMLHWQTRSKRIWTVARRLLWSLTLGLSWATPSLAAERLLLRVGPFEQSVEVSDLEQFAKDGEIAPSLQLYAPLLTPQVRKVLSSRLELDPSSAEKMVSDMLESPSGQAVLRSLQVAVPGLTVEQLQIGFALAARQANGLDAVSVIRAIPQETVTVDVTQAIAVASQLNLSYLKTQALSPILEQDLAVKTSPFRSSFDPTAPGTQSVQQQTLFLRDQQRNRSLPVELYWSDKTQGPLIVISPGFEANRTFLAYLAHHLASYGLTVAAIEHPFTANRAALPTKPGDLLPASEFVDRPKDISFLLDQLTRLNQQPGVLQGKLNTGQVSVIGHSLGGYTALALAGAELNPEQVRRFCQKQNPLQRAPADWLQCSAADLPERQLNLRDRRVVQVIALNPVVGSLFGSTGLRQIDIPVLILASTEDTLTPVLSHQLQPFSQLHQPKYLLTAIGGTHLSVSDPQNFSGAMAEGTLVKERRGQEVQPLRQLLQGVSLAFIEQLTPEAKTYEPFLSSAYAQSFSHQGLAFRFNENLPASLKLWLEVATLL